MNKYIYLFIVFLIPIFGDQFRSICYELPPEIAEEWDDVSSEPDLFRMYAPISNLEFLESDDGDACLEEAFFLWSSYKGSHDNTPDGYTRYITSQMLPFDMLHLDLQKVLDIYFIECSSNNSAFYEWYILYPGESHTQTMCGWTRIFLGSKENLCLTYMNTDLSQLACVRSTWFRALQEAYDISAHP